jgi:hypothetical protein
MMRPRLQVHRIHNSPMAIIPFGTGSGDEKSQ